MSDGQFEALFQRCVAESDAAYTSARDALLALDTVAVEPVQAKALGPEWQTKTVAEILLGWLQTRPLFEQVMPAIRGADGAQVRPISGELTPARRAAMLANRGVAIVPRLIEILTKTHEYTTGDELQILLLALDYLRDQRAVMPLVELVRDPDDDGLQALVLGTLGTLGDSRALDVARTALEDRGRRPIVRAAAAVCIGQLGDRQAVGALLAIVQDPGQALVLRESAVRALGYLGDRSAGATLAVILREAADERLALTTVDALAKLGDHAAAETLEEAARDHALVAVRRAARDAREGLPA
jgi:HEAT repeat protein